MTRAFSTRLARLERRHRGPPDYCLMLPHDHPSWGDDPAAELALHAAIAAHQERTGYTGPVLIGSEPCATEEEWMQRYGRVTAP